MEEKKISFSHDDYEIIKREILYQGEYRLALYHLHHRLFNGQWSKVFTREIFERPHAAAILPYDPKLDRIVLIEQFRTGAIENPKNPWLLEVVAGVFDKEKPDEEGDNIKENPEDVARREAEEEAGCKILDIYSICHYFVSPGGSNEQLHLYCGHIDASQVGGVHGLHDENEDIRAFLLSPDEAYTMVQEGKIKTSPAIISILWLQLNREWLKQLWLTK